MSYNLPAGVEYAGDSTYIARQSRYVNGEPADISPLMARKVRGFKSFCQRQRCAPAAISRRLSFPKQYVRYGRQRDVMKNTIGQDIQALPSVKTQPLAPRSLDAKALRRYLKEVDLKASRHRASSARVRSQR